MTAKRFFVIGAWSEGMLHYQKIQPFLVTSQSATMAADVYRVATGYPVLVENSTTAESVHGQMLEIQDDPTLMTLLDSFHGVHHADLAKGLHIRKTVQVRLDSGEVVDSEVYFYNPKKLTNKAEKLASGVWKEAMLAQPPLSEQLSDKQKSYVLKLGAAKARDIVPINDLALYRELMKLELIVDKGRRLALSSLGKEVYKHLV